MRWHSPQKWYTGNIMEHKEQVSFSERVLTCGQDICDRIEAVQGGLQEKVIEAKRALEEIRGKIDGTPSQEVLRQRYQLEKAALKLVEYYELEWKQEQIDLDLARRNAELVRIGVDLPGREHTTASNDDKYLVDSNQVAA